MPYVCIKQQLEKKQGWVFVLEISFHVHIPDFFSFLFFSCSYFSHNLTYVYKHTGGVTETAERDHNDKHNNLKLRLFTKNTANAQISIACYPSKEDSADKCTKFPA